VRCLRDAKFDERFVTDGKGVSVQLRKTKFSDVTSRLPKDCCACVRTYLAALPALLLE